MSWNEVPISKTQSESCHIAISISDLEKLQKGFTPRDMDDRWAINFKAAEGNPFRGIVSCVRSWTGFVIMQGEFRLLGVGKASASKVAVMDRILWEVDPKKDGPGAHGEEDIREQFIRMVNNILGTKLVDPSS